MYKLCYISILLFTSGLQRDGYSSLGHDGVGVFLLGHQLRPRRHSDICRPRCI